MNTPLSGSMIAQRLVKLWKTTQVSHRGTYSVERTLSLEEYSRSTTTTRALLVVLCTPLPALICSLAVELLPLYEPIRGWRINYCAWIRAATLTTIIGLLSGLDTRHLLSGRIISNPQIVLLAVIVTLVHTPVMVAVAALWVFPIPFTIVVMSVPYSIIYVVALRWLVGSEAIRRLRTHSSGAILHHLRYVQTNMALILVYPAFQALFSAMRGTHFELPMLLLVLPMIKTLMKQLMARNTSHLNDLIPELVVVSVEMFNALYLATCIQRLSSVSMGLVVFAVDVTQNAVALRGIYVRTSRMWRRHRQQNGPNWSGSLLTAVRTLIIAPRRLDAQTLHAIKTRSCVPHELSSNSQEILRSLEQGCANFFAPLRAVATRELIQHYESPKARWFSVVQAPSRPALASTCAPLPTNRIASAEVASRADAKLSAVGSAGFTSTIKPRAGPVAAAIRPMPRRSTRKSTLLLDSQRVLFTIEYVVLAEYFELFSQLFYVGFMAGLSRLPSAKYHSELADLGGAALSEMLVNNVFFVMLKVASFTVLVVTLRRVSGHDALRHLTFVLETRMVHVQVKMMLWILMVMGFRIVHFGVDFSFRFEWLNDKEDAQ